jgi:hypothetical protein
MPAVHVSVSVLTADATADATSDATADAEAESKTVSLMHTPQTDCLSLAHFLAVLLVHRKPLPPVPALSDATAAATPNHASSVTVIDTATATTEEVEEEEVGNLVDLDFAKANISGTRSNGGRAIGGAAEYEEGAGVVGSISSSPCTQITTLQVARRLVKLGLDISDLLASGAGASAAGGAESEALTEHVLVTPPSELESELEFAGEAAVVVSAENIAAESNNSVGYVML